MLRNFENEVYDVIILAGQSNAEGRGIGSVEKAYKPSDKIWSMNCSFTPLEYTISPDEEKVHPQIKAHMKELEHRAMSALGRKVRISRSSHKKVLELTYNDDEDLEALLRSLCGDNIFEEVTE